MSGIVSILTNGVFLCHYAAPNISEVAKESIKTIYGVVAYTSETVVFLFLGIGCFTFDLPFAEMGWGLLATTIINLNISRFLNIGISSLLVNCTRTKETRISLKTQFVMWFAGLRGAMAYALALQASEKLKTNGPIILVVTLLFALLTVIVSASMLNPVLNKMDVKNKHLEG